MNVEPVRWTGLHSWSNKSSEEGDDNNAEKDPEHAEETGEEGFGSTIAISDLCENNLLVTMSYTLFFY